MRAAVRDCLIPDFYDVLCGAVPMGADANVKVISEHSIANRILTHLTLHDSKISLSIHIPHRKSETPVEGALGLLRSNEYYLDVGMHFGKANSSKYFVLGQKIVPRCHGKFPQKDPVVLPTRVVHG